MIDGIYYFINIDYFWFLVDINYCDYLFNNYLSDMLNYY